MKRREFFNWVGLGLLASSLPVAIAACSPETTTSASSTSKAANQNWQKVGTVTELDKTGQLLVQDSPVGAVLVVGTSKNPNKLIAVNPTCTHKGCTVAWKKDKNQFVCPCHDAEFGGDGKVQEGPAEKPLKTYLAKIETGSVLVKPA
ncbi:ubiquinol-cytochrome c reductase iron-sulfur subunit [Sphaerospermopsis aphanizomenoides BCCUSP55]|uniref:QcrA and Rieske domain-containing protein n=1 Tax=Sphaerospermopsis aphanizomenoides TaxID=459663 RepID=UPI000A439E71|nr:ubiquinol-cytochrome c reductase iron-sulfur subunit [Sphaerospermopsis aphanizomenoides]MBK1989572.1 ubiquinol-cytochrome c reductase iron-sulfur subunit [Sphaerospermopsis aphanizomenoides BCCUSP55]